MITDTHGAVPLAPRWHTVALIALILAVAVTGAVLTNLTNLASREAMPPPSAAPSSRVMTVYLPMMVVQWGLALYVCRIGRPRNALPSLLGERWRNLGCACADIAIAVCGWVLIKAFELSWAKLFATVPSVASMLPHTSLERLAWVLVATSVGISEELVFRGYLQTQLTGLTGRPNVAILLQAALFGIAHGEQGAGAVIRLTVYGLLFGLIVRWRRSLLPVIACHVWTDLASGLIRV